MSRSSLAVVVLASLGMTMTRVAHADCAAPNVDARQLRPGETPCAPPTTVTPPASRAHESISPPGPAYEAETGRARWEERRGRLWESSLGPSLLAIASRDRASTFHAGATITVGVHWLVPHRRGSELDVSIPAAEGLRWCVPVACGGVGLLFAPNGSILGNELGVDLDMTGANDLGRVAIRPVLRYSEGAFRTPSFVSLFAPSLGFSRADTSDGVRSFAVIAFPLFPVDWRMGRSLALGITPLRAGLMVDLEGGPPRTEVALDLSLRFAP